MGDLPNAVIKRLIAKHGGGLRVSGGAIEKAVDAAEDFVARLAREAQASINRLVDACPNAVDFYKRFLNEKGYSMSAALRPAGNNPYAEADRQPLTDEEYAAFKVVYEAELSRYV